jgi:hypothetical protein
MDRNTALSDRQRMAAVGSIKAQARKIWPARTTCARPAILP